MKFPNLTAKTKMLLILAVVALIATIGIATAVSYGIRSPDSAPLVVNPTPTPVPTATPAPTPIPQATLSQVTFPTATITVGDSVTLTTTVSDATPGLSVTFRDQFNDAVAYATTNAAGVATATFQPPIGTWIYHADTVHP